MTIHQFTATGQPAGLRSTAAVAPGRWRLLLGACAVSVLAACASPAPNARLADAQSAFAQARSDTARAELAAAELDQANAALQRAERAWNAGDDRAEVDHLALLAQRRVELAMAAARRKETEMAIDRTGRERDAIQLGASRRQVDAAQAQATTSQMQAADLASRNAALQAAAAEQRQRAEALAVRLRELQAKETERGLVVTFSDVLFDTGRATLKAGALARIGQLADVMKEYPERNVLLEGFTDSTGSEATNQQLSERRALSVRQELVARRVDPRRIVTRGHSYRYPVADNSTAVGRQQNRRVEAVLSDAKGELPMRP